MSRKKIIVLIALVLALGGLVAVVDQLANDQQTTNQTLTRLPPDALPLYSGVTWKEAESSEYDGMQGVEVVSELLQNITNIAEVTMPFEAYYRDQLLARGWEEDIMFAAGGPGSAVIAYTKDRANIILSYQSEFLVQNENEPGQCPCNVQFSVFTSTESIEKELIDNATLLEQENTFSESEMTERYVGQVDRVTVVFEQSNYTHYRLTTNDLIREGELNTERGYKNDFDATVYVLNWRQSEGEQMRYVRLTQSPGKLFLLNSEGRIVAGSVLNLEE